MQVKDVLSNGNSVWFLNLFLVLGAFTQITGGYWDITRHIMDRPETFFTVQHLMIYTGVGITMIAALLGLVVRRTYRPDGEWSPALGGLKLAAVGAGLQIVAGPFDFWWHSTFGFDPVLLSPPHAMLIVGAAANGLAATLGMVGLRNVVVSGSLGPRLALRALATIFTVLAMAALWLDLNLVIYTASDQSGLAFQYHVFYGGTLVIPAAYSLAASLVSAFALAVPGVVILIYSARIFGRFGVASAVAATFITVNLITSIVERGFLWYVGPEVSMIVPAIVLDYLVSRGSAGKRSYLIAAMVYAPFSYALYFPFSTFYLGTDVLRISLYMLLPYLAAGFLGQRLSLRFGLCAPMACPVTRGTT